MRCCVPCGWSGLLRCLGAQRPVAPPARRGAPFLPRNGEKEGRGPSVIGRWFRWNRCRVAPATWVPARLRAGARLSPEKAGRKSAGGVAPWTPTFKARSFPLARFGVRSAAGRSLGDYGAHLRTLIWRLSFLKMLFSIFFLENASQIGLSIPEGIDPLAYQRKLPQKSASGNERP